ncbi:MAG: glycoside hydrolase family 3 N-terminal domain-containing protein [Bacteroidota bacterium]|nr:glycoside hydrolase family 3 N-terminal domain-containing protein [Bacteroidota bacterium]
MIKSRRKILLYLLKSLLFFPLFFLYSNDIVVSRNTSLSDSIIHTPPYLLGGSQWVDSVFSQMTNDEKIGQLLMIPAYSNKDAAHSRYVQTMIETYHVGGIIFFQGGPVRQAQLTNNFQSRSKIPLMIAGDYEWGLSMRLDSTVRYPRQMLMGATQDPKLIYDFGAETARQLRRLGIHINFAPVIDINNNAQNPVINSRSFGENRKNVASKGLMYMLGLQDNLILATGKHFPGHGDTDTDSHKDLPIIKHSKKRIDSLEAYPFKELINYGLGGIMVAHLNIPSLDSSKNSVSGLSRNIVTNYLKKDLGYQGLTFTDALGMRGVTKHNAPGETELKAFKAGVDILLMPESVPQAYKTLKAALRTGLISRKELDKKVLKILQAKRWFGLHNYRPIDTKNLIKDLNTPKAKLLNRKLTEGAVTIASDNFGIIPFTDFSQSTFASISIGNGQVNSFQQRMKNYGTIDTYAVFKNISEKSLNSSIKTLENYKFVVISLHNTNRMPPYFGTNPDVFSFIEKLSQKTNVVLAVFGNPYILNHLKHPEKIAAVVVSYNDRTLTRDITAQVLYGGIKADGQLPVSAGKHFKSGTGFSTKKIRLKYSEPTELNLKTEKLKQVDSVILKAIGDKATPGAVVIAAKDGVVFYRKAFGKQTYAGTQKTKVTDIYDLASLTKILATVPSLMQLYEEDKFSTGQTLGYYLPELDSTNKEHLKVSHILTHKAKLKSWIPFYLHTMNESKTGFKKGIYSSKKSKKYSVQVADNLYMNNTYTDTLYQEIFDSKLRKRKGYKYSDLGFYLFKKIIENTTESSLDVYTNNNFYRPLGATTMGYLPLNRFPKSKIIPTEDDKVFRKQLLRGHVHDYGAAMSGGVNGHAGLFSNADDVAKIMQMYLQYGSYGGKRYFMPKTIKEFTACPYCKEGNRRGLGFDHAKRPKGGPTAQIVSNQSFGHSGFTGTYAWVDPKYDFMYIFLSNRIHPDIENHKLLKDNVRTKIQQLFYESFIQENKLAEMKNDGLDDEFAN